MYTVREANIPLPDWEKERPKLTATKSVDECGSMDNSKKLMPPPLANVRIPVVRDASEFKELTQVIDKIIILIINIVLVLLCPVFFM